MENIPVKLKVPPPPFNYFEDNQVLTATQLNNAIRYFDYQDRLTRTRLIGAGIVCGLKVLFGTSDITITKGCGLTSDGDIISLPQDLTYVQLTAFDDSKAQYLPFRNDEKQIPLFELMVKGAQSPGNQEVTPINTFFSQNGAADYVVLLYLSQFLEDTDICSSVDCDNKGVLQQNNLHALLISKADYERIHQDPDCCSEQYFDMPEAFVPRVIFNPASDVFNYNNFKKQYEAAIAQTTKLLAKPLGMADDLAKALQKCYLQSGEVPQSPAVRLTAVGGTRPVLTDAVTEGDNVRPTAVTRPTATLNTELISRISTLGLRLPASLVTRFRTLSGSAAADFQARMPDLLKATLESYGIQYLYDFTKDVAVAYTEFREATFDLCQGCCIAPELFPKHLALGLVQDPSDEISCRYRQCFIESPILNNKDEQLRRALYLYNRLVQIIQSYNYNSGARDQGVRITPTVNTERPLGEKSIPYYYTQQSLVEEWDYERYRRRAIDTHLNYFAAENAPEAMPHIRQPLDYDLDKYNFFRIEGHVGKTYENVYSQIDKLREGKDLPFEIMGLQLDAIRNFIIPKWEYHPPYLDVLHEMNKFKLTDYLDKMKGYNDDLELKLPTELELAVPGVSNYYGNAKDIRSKAVDKKKELDKEIADIKPFLSLSINQLKTKDFAPVHESIAVKAAVLNNGAKLLTRTSLSTPLQSIAQIHTPALLDWIKNLAVDTSEAIKDSYIFMNFLKDNPSLLHNAGVQKGGTFLIVYAVVNTGNRNERVVVGDFYVPYIVQPQQVAKPNTPLPIKPIQVASVRPLPAHIFDLVPDIKKPPILNLDFINIKDKLDKDIFEVNGKFTDLKATVNEKVLDINTSVNTKLGTLATKGEVQSLVTENMMNVARDYKQNFDSVVQVIKTRDLTAGVAGFEAANFGKMELNEAAIKNLTPNEMEIMAANYRDSLAKLEQNRTDFSNFNFVKR